MPLGEGKPCIIMQLGCQEPMLAPGRTSRWSVGGVVQETPLETDTVAGDDIGNIMWMREKWRELVGKTYGTERSAPLHPEGMDDVVDEIKQVQAEGEE